MELRTCLREECNNLIPKKTHESKPRYEKKKFCSQECAKIYLKENKIGWFSSDVHSVRPRRERWPDEVDITETTNY